MKKLYVAIFALLALTPVSIFAKDTILRTNLLGQLFHVQGVEIEQKISEQAAISIDYWNSNDSPLYMLLGGDVSSLRVIWRYYLMPNQTGLFFGAGGSYLTKKTPYPTDVNSTLAFEVKYGIQSAPIMGHLVGSVSGGFTVPLNKNVMAIPLINVGVNVGVRF